MDYERWTNLDEAALARADVAQISFDLAADLPGADVIEVHEALATLDRWAEHVREMMASHRRAFRRAPDQCGKTEVGYRLMCLATVLQRDCGVGYNHALLGGAFDGRNARNLFLHGTIFDRQGTCASLPALYTAVGRRLGFPLYLVEAREHLFVRWQGTSGERMNLETTSRGFVSHPDEYYLTWPTSLSESDLRSGHFLRNMTPREELACLLAQRSACQRDNLRTVDAMHAAKIATDLDGYHRGRWAVCTMIHHIWTAMRAQKQPRDLSIERWLDNSTPPLRDPWERAAAPIARRELLRILKLPPAVALSPVRV